jgi:hypothetical protein
LIELGEGFQPTVRYLNTVPIRQQYQPHGVGHRRLIINH